MSSGGGHLGFGIFCYFRWKRFETVTVSVPCHHTMAQMKSEVVLMSIETLIQFLSNFTMERLINIVAPILHFVHFGGQRLEKSF